NFNPSADVITDVRLLVRSTGVSSVPETYQIVLNGPVPPPSCVFTSPSSGYVDYTQLDCGLSTAVSNVRSVTVFLLHGGSQDGTYGVREVQVFKPLTSFPTPTVTNTPSVTSTPTITPTPKPPAHPGNAKSPTQVTPTATRTSTRSSTPVGGLGRGPGDDTTNAPNLQASGGGQVVNIPLPSSTPLPAQTGGPVEFTIVLEVASGTGYP